jgi:hypothetical protein
MLPTYWIAGFALIGMFFWLAKRSNGKRARKQRHTDAERELARENYRLRHVLAEMSMENYSLKCTPPDPWTDMVSGPRGRWKGTDSESS